MSSVLSSIPPVWRIGFIGTTILATVMVLASVRSEKVHSMADYVIAICATSSRSPPPEEAPYLSETTGAMTKMMINMGIQPTGDVDRDFVEMMVPHHQGAIEAAIAVLRYGRNPRIKRLAQEIIVTQQEEIAAMRLATGEPLPPSTSSPSQSQSSHQTNSYAASNAERLTEAPLISVPVVSALRARMRWEK